MRLTLLAGIASATLHWGCSSSACDAVAPTTCPNDPPGASIVDAGAGAPSCKQKGCDSAASALNSCIGSLPKDSFGSRCGPDGRSDPTVAAKIEHACSPQINAYLACLSK